MLSVGTLLRHSALTLFHTFLSNFYGYFYSCDSIFFSIYKYLLVRLMQFGALDFGTFVREGEGSNPSVPNYLVLDGGQWRGFVSSGRVDPVLNGYLEKSGEGKQDGYVKAQDGWPPTPHCTSWLKGQETEISTAVRDCKVQGCVLYLLPLCKCL